ncbi:MAG: DUF3108 domain-containing protein [Gammaproteobacteria bacterium]|nr:DUF3108 domain-containing protein [Gammaproteobacteria bacterium]
MRNLRWLLILLLTSLSFGTHAAEPFRAEYTVFKGANKIGNAVLSVTTNENIMRWQLETEASGILALFTNKKPFSESVMHKSDSDFRLSSVLVALRRDDTPQETVHLNWQQQQVEIITEGQRRQHFLQNAVYDFLSIHWLAAEMTRNAARKIEFDFYRRGKLIKSKLRLTNQTEIELGEKTIPVNCYMQTFLPSTSKYRYCYDISNPLMPLKIEKTKPGKKSTILQLKPGR